MNKYQAGQARREKASCVLPTTLSINMNNILDKLEKHLASIPGVEDELLPPATVEKLDAAEDELGVKFPDEFRQLYMWHNGNKGILFLFGSYRIFSINELVELNKHARNAFDKDWYKVTDDSRIFKDCIANPNWILFADNGGNTSVYLDLDPGQLGVPGQIIEACDGEKECHFSGIKEFISDINHRISVGNIAWNEEAGSFWETNDESIAGDKRSTRLINLVDSAPNLDDLMALNTGDEISLIGAIKPNNKTKKHQLFIRGGPIWVTGVIGKTNTGLSGGPPIVKVRVKIGKKTLFGFGEPTYEVISFELIPD